LSVREAGVDSRADFLQLLKLGGFPEPFFGSDERGARLWSRENRRRIVREDVAAVEGVKDLANLELLTARLPGLVGSPLSINSIREDLDLSHNAISEWIEILEKLFFVFRLSPFASARVSALRKEQRHYHFDWSLVPRDRQRFENLVASHLLKWVHFEQDTKGRDVDLRYFRDTVGHEVDFVVVEKRAPILMVQTRWGDEEVDRGLLYLKHKFPKTPAWQISAVGRKDRVTPEGIRVSPALPFLAGLI